MPTANPTDLGNPKSAPRAVVAHKAAISPAQGLQPSATIRIGSGARWARNSESAVPDATDANSSAAAAPAPTPTSTICSIASCPASSAVRDDQCPPQPSARCPYGG